MTVVEAKVFSQEAGVRKLTAVALATIGMTEAPNANQRPALLPRRQRTLSHIDNREILRQIPCNGGGRGARIRGAASGQAGCPGMER